jgi:tRNA1(Val) A37 N6-methylase TrmN6
MTAATPDVSEDTCLGGRLRLLQPRSGHRAGHDAILLAAATLARSGDRVVDFGAGVGTAGLAVATRVAGIDLVMIERDEHLAGLARTNADLNGIAAQVCVLDIAGGAGAFAASGLGPDSVDAVLMNPPFNDVARHRASPDDIRRTAHMAEPETLETWIHAARRVLKSSGALSLIWRADGLAEVLNALERGFGGVVVRPVHADAGKPAIRVVVRAIKGSRAPLRLCAGLMLNDESGEPNPEAQAILAGARALALAEDT